MTTTTDDAARLRGPSLLLGFGLGAFADGIVLHQLLQWHHLVSSYESPDDLRGLEANTFWDGVFHTGAWVVVVAGLLWLVGSGHDVRALRLRRFWGLLLMGWGAFHVVDQALFHLALGAHHIRPGEHTQLYDWGYTAIGVVMVVAGRALARGR